MTIKMLDTDSVYPIGILYGKTATPEGAVPTITKLEANSLYGKSPNQSVIDLLMAEKEELEQFFATHIGLPPTVALAIQEAALQRHMWVRDLKRSMEVNGK